ncbi:CYTH domain-containing protein [Pyrococcus furiosus DSM 3638]|uniref:CYTH domain-containing protein n=3 Tax=Pyrococcus furiosus TaxID=2261 RepID=A0A5C0XNL1_PYRFU|nr:MULTISPECIES: class IV adenylate cyclase [Pyrococcus]AAL80987.1 hypothetical protein PF0863 [Pyrococcus furiosus DSM 3638]AFN03654.1 hypothetical protein PFC_03525 [Pyrococcus furiosus COM1]MDK2869804.1 adenylate cyclase, class 2 [Pyrococcus sp.]QEK78537.1 CYTH domain-containing protein [Pyrococcus furiosus DSM 3638]
MEVEIKFKIKLEDFLHTLNTFNPEFVRYEEQEDVYFEVPRPKLLRIRGVHNLKKYYLTFKEILDENNEEFYEVEFEIGDFEKAVEVFKRLGFKIQATIKKKRWVYKLNGVTLEVNRVEGIGDFVDIEVISDSPEEAKEKIWEVAKMLGLKEEDVEPRLYLELINELSGRSS